ncbi:unnamed protein product [Boreogadus saida]
MRAFFRPWSEVYRLARLASSLLAYGVHLCFIPGRGPLRYPVPIALNHVQVDNRGASTSQRRLTRALALRHGWHFRHQEHLSYWDEQTTDPWIVSTLSNGTCC